ncbi:MAG TPA: Asp-tRNA(Asn)/Glu-tRNA(Gln) amidotransferase subunit GatC [Patescibacteria group bacterium]|nr:Asp-tRNA(Asn)/Glu-tRNA(Gln) amidotransferase subunit GatC [Patescibacteria group bacterium]
MAKLTLDDTKKVASLARLQLTDKEIEKFTKQLSKVLDHIDELNQIDTKNVEPTSQTTGLVNVLRNDEIDETKVLTQDEALSGTENTINGFFVVPQILNKNV